MSSTEQFAVVVPWHNPDQRRLFVEAWGIDKHEPEFLVMQHDQHAEGCAVTKNKGVARAVEGGADIVVVLDDDCYPDKGEEYASHHWPLHEFVKAHIRALQPQDVEAFRKVTVPASRGTPYLDEHLTVSRPVAASMGFWTEIGDYCAVRQLVWQGGQMTFDDRPEASSYFPLSGMNLAFRPKDWMPWCQFIDVPRYDDIWMGWLWQREAYARGHCFALNGPRVRHSRQSNVWRNLEHEARYAEDNETLWQRIAAHPLDDYDSLRSLLPV